MISNWKVFHSFWSMLTFSHNLQLLWNTYSHIALIYIWTQIVHFAIHFELVKTNSFIWPWEWYTLITHVMKVPHKVLSYSFPYDVNALFLRICFTNVTTAAEENNGNAAWVHNVQFFISRCAHFDKYSHSQDKDICWRQLLRAWVYDGI